MAIQFNSVDIQRVQADIAQMQNDPLRWRRGMGRDVTDTMRDAILAKRRDVVQLLLDAKANVHEPARNDQNDGHSLFLEFAARVRDFSMMALLLDRGATLGRAFCQNQLEGAVQEGDANVVESFLKGGVYPTADCLIQAVSNGAAPVAAVLVQYGADLCVAMDNLQEDYCRLSGREADLKQPQHRRAHSLLFDLAQGVDVEGGHWETLDVSGFNFVGVSVGGRPITREGLERHKVQGAEKALCTIADIEQCPDEARKSFLLARLEKAFAARGRVVQEGIVNLVSLPLAASTGQTDIVTARLAAGVDPNEGMGIGGRKLGILAAAEHGHESVIRLLAAHPKIVPESVASAFSIAQRRGLAPLAEFLASRLDVNQYNTGGLTFLHRAVAEGDLEEVKRLLQRGADVSLRTQDGEGLTPLQIAVAPGGVNMRFFEEPLEPEYIQIVELLLAQPSINPNEGGQFQASPMQRAIEAGHIEIVRVLLPRIVRDPVNGAPWYNALIHSAFSWPEWRELCDLLCSAGASCDLHWDAVGRPAKAPLLSKLLDKFPSFTTVQAHMQKVALGEMPFSKDVEDVHAIQREIGDFQAFQQKMQQEEKYGFRPSRATVAWKEEQARTQAREAEKFPEYLEKLEYLLAHGVNVQTDVADGNTACHLFLRDVDLDFIPGATEKVLDLFLKEGRLDVDAKNAAGKTLLDIAKQKKRVEAAQYIRARSKRLN